MRRISVAEGDVDGEGPVHAMQRVGVAAVLSVSVFMLVGTNDSNDYRVRVFVLGGPFKLQITSHKPPVTNETVHISGSRA